MYVACCTLFIRHHKLPITNLEERTYNRIRAPVLRYAFTSEFVNCLARRTSMKTLALFLCLHISNSDSQPPTQSISRASGWKTWLNLWKWTWKLKWIMPGMLSTSLKAVTKESVWQPNTFLLHLLLLKGSFIRITEAGSCLLIRLNFKLKKFNSSSLFSSLQYACFWNSFFGILHTPRWSSSFLCLQIQS